MIDAQRFDFKWSEIFKSTTGMIFFETLFRNVGELNQTKMIRTVQSQYAEDQVQEKVLNILFSDNESLIDLTTYFFETRQKESKIHIICFFEQKSSNVGVILRESRIQMSQKDLNEVRSKLIEKKEIRDRWNFWLSGSEWVDEEILSIAGSFQYEQVRTVEEEKLSDDMRSSRKDDEAVGRSYHDSKTR